MTLTSREVANFTNRHIRPLLGPDYHVHKKTSLVRMRGPFAQAMLLGRVRSGSLMVNPILSMVGSRAGVPQGLIETVGAAVLQPRSWRFADPGLDDHFARRLVDDAGRALSISFRSPLSDEAIEAAIRRFSKKIKGRHFTPDLFLAFFNFLRGSDSAKSDVVKAIRSFERNSNLNVGEPLRDWEEALYSRLHELGSRAERPDGRALCRAEAEEHARGIGFPPIVWPPEWPV